MQNTLAQFDTRSEAARRPLRVALCGEVSSGKSALANAIARRTVLPDLFGISHDVVIRIEAAAGEGWTGVFADGRRRVLDCSTPLPIEDGLTELIIRPDAVAEHLRGLELVELPAFCHENVRETDVARVAECDVLIWTTIGSQAWRLSEKTIIERIGAAWPAHSLLAITRGDKFRSEEDRAKVLSRVTAEAGDLFDRIVMTGAAGKTVLSSAADDAAWEQSGGAEVHAFLSELRESRETISTGAVPLARVPIVEVSTVVSMADYRATPAGPDDPEPVPGTEGVNFGELDGVQTVARMSLREPETFTLLHSASGDGAGYAQLAVQVAVSVAMKLGGEPDKLDLGLPGIHVSAGPIPGRGEILILVADGQAMTRGAARVLHDKLAARLGRTVPG